MRPLFLFIISLVVISTVQITAQNDTLQSKLNFELDFRFRVEQDWDSRKVDGSFRDDRTRLRYRVRTGATYQRDWYKLGARIRTGNQNKQQDPQLTLGKGYEEFGTLPIGFEKIFFQGKHRGFKFWLGKNTFSFEKNNELFWSDNVYPEGFYFEQSIKLESSNIEKITFRGSHYILSSNGLSLLDDAYFQGVQASFHSSEQRIAFFPSVYLFRNIPDIPDGNHNFFLDYSIFYIGSKIKVTKDGRLRLDFDVYQNLEDYTSNSAIPSEFAEEKLGYSLGLQYGQLEKARDWNIKITYTALQKYAALDYMAQNDWARWDYSNFESPDGRLTNLQGIELVVGYNISEKVNLIAKYYKVNQIIPSGEFNETGQRVRLDLNVEI